MLPYLLACVLTVKKQVKILVSCLTEKEGVRFCERESKA